MKSEIVTKGFKVGGEKAGKRKTIGKPYVCIEAAQAAQQLYEKSGQFDRVTVESIRGIEFARTKV